jgi:sirohydrochlorin ferrochelatase
VRVVTYGPDPIADLRGTLSEVAADRAFAVPVCPAHTHETTDAVPRALSYLDADTRYCEPVGRHPAITAALGERATAALDPGPDAGLALVGLGNSAGSYSRRLVETHADRLRERTDFGAVRCCYLLQNPAVECVRYSLPTDRAVVVPVFISPGPATEASIPERLDLDRGGLAYADPLGTHPAVTDAIEAAVNGERAADGMAPSSFENALADARSPLATDGEG